jgi:hypothetical protein
MYSRPVLATAAATALFLLCGCAPDAATESQSETGLGSSGLAPKIKPEHRKGHAEKAEHRTEKHRKRRDEPKQSEEPRPDKPRTKRPAAGSTAKPGPAEGSTTAAAEPAPHVLRASLTDPSGDVKGSLTGAPGYVDITGATVTRNNGGFELALDVAGAVPARQTDPDRTMNAASFYDLDGDGTIDYEIWATLADNGWSGSYRTPSGASYNDDSGVTATPRGHTLLIRFSLGHLDRATRFRWAVGAEWGTYTQIAAGTTAEDNAPGQGVVAFPE